MRKVLLGMTAVLLLVGCGEEKKAEMWHSVMTVQPQATGTNEVKHFAGTVKEQGDVNLGFKTAGQILKIYVKEGQHVQKGQLLARLDDKDYLLGVRAAEAQHTQLQHEVERLKKLYEARSISGNDYEKATSGLEQVEVNLENNRNKVAYTRLYAPASGIVQAVNFEEMEMVNAGTPVFNIIYTQGLQVEVNIPTSTYLQRGSFKGSYADINGQHYALRLISIVPKADNTQLYKATFALEGASKSEKLKDVASGMNADVTIDIDGGNVQAALSLPLHAVFERDGKSYVWVVGKDSTVTQRPITVGNADEQGNITIVSGLTGIETIVKAGVNALQDKEKVKIIGEDSETNVGGML